MRGNVAEAGRFSWHPGMRLSDIIPDSQSLITRDYWERRNQLGVPGPQFKPEYATNPDYYPRDINGYQTGVPQYDANGVPLFYRENPYTSSQGQSSNVNGQQGSQNSAQNNTQNGSQTPVQSYDPNCETGQNNVNQQQYQLGLGIYSGYNPYTPRNSSQNGQPCNVSSSGPVGRTVGEEEQASSVNLPGRRLRSLYRFRRLIGPTR